MTAHQAVEDAEFLACPFCGSDDVSASIGKTGDGKEWHYVECANCAGCAEPDFWNRRAERTGAQGATSSAVIDIDAALLKLSAETNKSVNDAIQELRKLDGISPISAQWWSIVSMALYKAYLLGRAELTGAQPVQRDEQAAFETWLSEKCPSGDVMDVQRQWEASSAYAAIAQAEQPTTIVVAEAIPGVRGPRPFAQPKDTAPVLVWTPESLDAAKARAAEYAPWFVGEQGDAKAALTDEQIEDLVLKCGGKWYGSVWQFEDADLHPFVRTILASKPGGTET